MGAAPLPLPDVDIPVTGPQAANREQSATVFHSGYFMPTDAPEPPPPAPLEEAACPVDEDDPPAAAPEDSAPPFPPLPPVPDTKTSK